MKYKVSGFQKFFLQYKVSGFEKLFDAEKLFFYWPKTVHQNNSAPRNDDVSYFEETSYDTNDETMY